MCRVILESSSSSDPGTRAIVRGRSITAALARVLSPYSGHTEAFRAAIAAGDREAWRFAIDPSGGWLEPIRRADAAPLPEPDGELVKRARAGDR